MDEVRTSRRQAAWLSGLVAALHYEVKPGPSPAIRFPGAGPFDERLGYHRLPELVQRLAGQGFAVSAQARMSPRMIEFVDEGLFATYREKTQAGLELRDCRGQPLTVARYPERIYERFESVPPLLVDSLLFIENRELLDPRFPMRNPAVEWDRFGKALADQALRRLDESHAAAGGSTLATQIEKYRHSPEGRTDTPREKLRQMASASLRAYLDGENTLPRRRQIVVDYLNTVPLSAKAGFGEVNGIGDGLWAWYGRDFAEVNRLLAAPMADNGPDAGARPGALAFKQALSLMVAQRRPSYYLAEGEPALRQLTDSYLRVLADAGVITPALRDAALPLALKLQTQSAVARPGSFIERKAANAVRGKLQALLAMPRSYDLDRLDLTVGERAGRRGAARRHRAAARPGRSAGGARRRPVRLSAAERGRRHQQDHLQLHAVRARRAQQPAARADRQLRPALRPQRGRAAGPRLDRQAAHARHLPGAGRRLAPALERPVGRAARRAARSAATTR